MQIQEELSPHSQPFKSSQRALNFTQIQQQLILITEEVHRRHKLSLIDRLKDILFLDEDGEPLYIKHIDGSVLSEKLKTREALQLSVELDSCPASLSKRVKLVCLILSSKIPLTLKDYRNLLVQSCLPVYIGYVTPFHLQICAQVFRLYLKKVIQFHKKKLLTVRSNQLGGLNVSRITLKDIIKSVGEGEKSEEAFIVSEIRYAHALLENSRELLKLMPSRITIPVDLSELNLQTPVSSEPSMFIGDIDSERIVPDKRALLTRKVIAILEVIKDIYPLHSLGLRVASRLQEIEEKLPQTYHIEGKIRMEALKLAVLRVRSGDMRDRTGLQPGFNQVLEVYRKALKFVSLNNPQSNSTSALADFVQMTLFAQSHMALLEMDIGRMRQLLYAAQKASNALVRIDRRHDQLKLKLNKILIRYGILNQQEKTIQT